MSCYLVFYQGQGKGGRRGAKGMGCENEYAFGCAERITAWEPSLVSYWSMTTVRNHLPRRRPPLKPQAWLGAPLVPACPGLSFQNSRFPPTSREGAPGYRANRLCPGFAVAPEVTIQRFCITPFLRYACNVAVFIAHASTHRAHELLFYAVSPGCVQVCLTLAAFARAIFDLASVPQIA